MKKTIYLDNAATTPLSQDVFKAMADYMKNYYANPSGHYDIGYDASDRIMAARKYIGSTINAFSDEIYFTSGGTESDNWALRFVRPGSHIITTSIEHHAILNTCKYLESIGIDITYIKPNADGFVNPEDIEKEIRSNTQLVSVMMANNEIGTIQPIKEIGAICSKNNIVLHTDAVQAYGHVPIDINDLGIDMMSVSAHKFNGPKGVGFLYVSNRIPIKPLIYGGGQQKNLRSGTENVSGIIGLEEAARISHNKMKERTEYIQNLRDYFVAQILCDIPDVSINGSMNNRLANNANIKFAGVRSEQLLTLLNMNGICASAGSACNSSSDEPSHVLTAIGLSKEDAESSVRFTLSHDTTMEDIDFTVNVLGRSVKQLREIKG